MDSGEIGGRALETCAPLAVTGQRHPLSNKMWKVPVGDVLLTSMCVPHMCASAAMHVRTQTHVEEKSPDSRVQISPQIPALQKSCLQASELKGDSFASLQYPLPLRGVGEPPGLSKVLLIQVRETHSLEKLSFLSN